ncbi:MAG: TIGR04255 family protein [Sulfuriflexus sp.]|nr:TIGR04255 family protein [Sulfuriflexus sp.]
MKYNNNFLTRVIFRLDFSTDQPIVSDSRPRFSDDISALYPNISSREVAGVTVTLSGETQGYEKKNVGWIWEHKSADGKKTISVGHDHLSLIYEGDIYSDGNEFIAEFTMLYERFSSDFGVTMFTRAGLRYINEINIEEGSPLDWDTIISEDLIVSVKAGIDFDDDEVLRSMHQLVTKNDGVKVLFNYGMHNPDYPNPVARKNFVLDIDCSLDEDIQSGDIVNSIKKLNIHAENTFESAIGDGLRDLMGSGS